MKKWELTASVDAVDIDYSEIIESEKEPDFWTCEEIANAHGCEWWSIEEIKPTAAEMVAEIAAKVEKTKTRSAWDKGVKAYALEMLEEMAFNVEHGYIDADVFGNSKTLRETLLNGAQDWKQYSYGGCSLIYDGDIAERLCAPWELRKTEYGRKEPNPSESWIDVQSRALFQAAQMILNAAFGRGC